MKKMGLVIFYFCSALLIFVYVLNAMDIMQGVVKVKKIEVFEYRPEYPLRSESEFIIIDPKNQA